MLVDRYDRKEIAAGGGDNRERMKIAQETCRTVVGS
jgi:hypothetical protein